MASGCWETGSFSRHGKLGKKESSGLFLLLSVGTLAFL